MSREIKFRAWDKESKKMWEVSAWHSTGGVHVRDSRLLLTAGEYVLMQYTGLKDKNGKEIYEGDIFNHPDFDEPTVVEYEPSSEPYPWSYWHDPEESEIIGNIYENKELLK